MIPWLKHRRRQAEWMDAPDADPQQLRASLRFIRRINAWLGYNRLMTATLARYAGRHEPPRRLRILDVATGSADVPADVLTWADSVKGYELSIIGLDLHADTLRFAAGVVSHRRLTFVRADARALPFEDAAVDYAISAMFLHHLSEEDAIAVLREMGRVASCGVIVSDLLRHRRAYVWISLFTLFSVPMIRHDARVSVAQAFTTDQVQRLFAAAGMPDVQIRRRFGHRFVAVRIKTPNDISAVTALSPDIAACGSP